LRCAAAAFLLAAAPALAESPPAVQPRRDVDVTYKVPVGGKDVALLQRLRFSASLHKQRVDLPTSGNWMVLDYGAHTLSVIRDETREIVDLPAPETATQPGAAGFAKLGPASIAGFACTEWRTRDTRGNETIACYTADGVLLQARNDTAVMMQAVTIAYGPQPDSTFTLPPGYTHTRPQ
jgi:hypothetical protein